MMKDNPWILASNSPRRKELMALFGQPFRVHPADVDEDLRPAENPAEYVCRLAREKASRVAALWPDGGLILAADTTVALDGKIFAKPVDRCDAKKMLLALRGRTHQVYTAVTLHLPDMNLPVEVLCMTDVPMRAYNEDEIDAYVDSGDPLDKAGAYAIQNDEFHPVEQFRGCFASVMGMPLCHIAYAMAQSGIRPSTAIDTACQQHLGYDCLIHERVLQGENLG
ncbi:MAG: septum formation protein Maf [Chloroflexi bacterium 44-23]|nr:MAG: septum formation protein Maf [Chloroflexi bacterium 44-23]